MATQGTGPVKELACRAQQSPDLGHSCPRNLTLTFVLPDHFDHIKAVIRPRFIGTGRDYDGTSQ